MPPLLTSPQFPVPRNRTVTHGKAIRKYSYFDTEDEVLISPQARFTVSSLPYDGPDGYTYLNMVETAGTTFVS